MIGALLRGMVLTAPDLAEESMTSVREQMNIVNAYREVGTFRGAAVLCGTTHKTVKRVLERQEREQVGRRPARPLKTALMADLIERSACA